jgi:divalent metal cation (Fe/Co/Zn/Cd) transporter
VNILFSGVGLVRESVGGLMDESDPEIRGTLTDLLDEHTSRRGLQYHELRHRSSGVGVWVDVHLLFPATTTIEVAHREATEIEAAIESRLPGRVTITTHLEPIERHAEVHEEVKNGSG